MGKGKKILIALIIDLIICGAIGILFYNYLTK